MSAYLGIPVDIDTMVCTTCGAESFAWLAEVFACPVCSNIEFIFPAQLGNDQVRAEDSEVGAGAVADAEESCAGLRPMNKKRKKSLNDKNEL